MIPSDPNPSKGREMERFSNEQVSPADPAWRHQSYLFTYCMQ